MRTIQKCGRADIFTAVSMRTWTAWAVLYFLGVVVRPVKCSDHPMHCGMALTNYSFELCLIPQWIQSEYILLIQWSQESVSPRFSDGHEQWRSVQHHGVTCIPYQIVYKARFYLYAITNLKCVSVRDACSRHCTSFVSNICYQSSDCLWSPLLQCQVLGPSFPCVLL